jgi:hypothetical protein
VRGVRAVRARSPRPSQLTPIADCPGHCTSQNGYVGCEGMSRSRRISVRLSDVQMERLRQSCVATGHSVTHVVNEALDTFLATESGTRPSGAPIRRMSPPEEITRFTSRYLALGERRAGSSRFRTSSTSLWQGVVRSTELPQTCSFDSPPINIVRAHQRLPKL